MKYSHSIFLNLYKDIKITIAIAVVSYWLLFYNIQCNWEGLIAKKLKEHGLRLWCREDISSLSIFKQHEHGTGMQNIGSLLQTQDEIAEQSIHTNKTAKQSGAFRVQHKQKTRMLSKAEHSEYNTNTGWECKAEWSIWSLLIFKTQHEHRMRMQSEVEHLESINI